MGFIYIPKDLVIAVLANSGGRFDGRAALGSAREAAFRPSG